MLTAAECLPAAWVEWICKDRVREGLAGLSKARQALLTDHRVAEPSSAAIY
jgi:hypothetical protein